MFYLPCPLQRRRKKAGQTPGKGFRSLVIVGKVLSNSVRIFTALHSLFVKQGWKVFHPYSMKTKPDTPSFVYLLHPLHKTELSNNLKHVFFHQCQVKK